MQEGYERLSASHRAGDAAIKQSIVIAFPLPILFISSL